MNGMKEEKVPLLQESGRKPSKLRQAVILLACMYLHFMSLGYVPVLGVVYVELIRYFDSARSEAAMVQSCFQGLTYVGGIVFSGYVAKTGVGLPVMVASAAASVALLASSFSVNIYMVIVLVGVFGGLLMSINYLCAFVAVGWTFSKHRRAALAFLTVATAIGQTSFPTVSDYLIDEYGWSGTFVISSGLMLNCIPCGLILHFTQKCKKNVLEQSKTETSVSKDPAFSCSSKQDIAFMLFIVVSTVYAGSGAVETWFIVDLSELRGLSRQAGTVLLSLVGLFGLLGRLLGTILLRVFANIKLAIPLTVSFMFFGLAHFVVTYFDTYTGMLDGIVLRGISIGLIMCLLPGMQLELRGVNRFPRTVAICNVVTGSGLVAFGYLYGSFADWTGGYGLDFYIAAGAAVLCGLFMLVIKCLQ